MDGEFSLVYRLIQIDLNDVIQPTQLEQRTVRTSVKCSTLALCTMKPNENTGRLNQHRVRVWPVVSGFKIFSDNEV